MTNTNIQSLQQQNNHKTTSFFKVFEEFESTDYTSYGYGSSPSSSEDYSPKSVGVKKFKNMFGRRVRNQIERIRAEDSHLGEDVGECLIAKVCTAGHDHSDVDVIIFSRPASPLSGKVAPRISLVQ